MKGNSQQLICALVTSLRSRVTFFIKYLYSSYEKGIFFICYSGLRTVITNYDKSNKSMNSGHTEMSKRIRKSIASSTLQGYKDKAYLDRKKLLRWKK